MEVEIWSDIACPFCYIGKKRFYSALMDFSHRPSVNVTWRSFILDPNLETGTYSTLAEYLIASKGISPAEAEAMIEYAVNMAASCGLRFNPDKIVVANTKKAHRLIKLANLHSKDNQAVEHLFKAYFEEGHNIDSDQVLIEIGQRCGIATDELEKLLQTRAMEDDVERDLKMAAKLGIRGVPFFLFNRRFAVSGAQSETVFSHALQKACNEPADTLR
ncbi:MAG: DsbA family oxidoreductase [Salibacteraceae bacterium]